MEFLARRQEPHETALVGALVSDRADSIDMKCAIREFSMGACHISSSNIDDLPHVVRILPEGLEAPLTGKIIWRNRNFAGVRFISEAEAVQLERIKPVRKRQSDAAGIL